VMKEKYPVSAFTRGNTSVVSWSAK